MTQNERKPRTVDTMVADAGAIDGGCRCPEVPGRVLRFYEGTWPGLDPVDPIAVGAMNVVVRVDAPDASLRREMTEAVGRIVRAAASEAPLAEPARSTP